MLSSGILLVAVDLGGVGFGVFLFGFHQFPDIGRDAGGAVSVAVGRGTGASDEDGIVTDDGGDEFVIGTAACPLRTGA